MKSGLCKTFNITQDSVKVSITVLFDSNFEFRHPSVAGHRVTKITSLWTTLEK